MSATPGQTAKPSRDSFCEQCRRLTPHTFVRHERDPKRVDKFTPILRCDCCWTMNGRPVSN